MLQPMKKTLVAALILSFALLSNLTLPAVAESSFEGQIIKLESSDTLYYVASDGQRYVFPNEHTYKSWFVDFSDVVVVTEAQLAEILLAGTIRYRPGVLLIKIQTDPKVYAVSRGGVLRWVKTENIAQALYGEDWNKLIDDLSAAFFSTYTIGADIDQSNDFDPEEEINETETIDADRGLKIRQQIRRQIRLADTDKCRAVPAMPALTQRGVGVVVPAQPAISARECARNKNQDDDDNDNATTTPDIINPIISGLTTTPTTTSALVSWVTNELANSRIEFSLEPPSTASSTDAVSNANYVLNHSLTLNNLTASTTYYFLVESADQAGNMATTTSSFNTLR